MRWAIIVSLIAFPIIIVIGFTIFSGRNEDVVWKIPWILYVLTSGLNFIIGVCLSFFEGCNQIAKIQKNKVISSVVTTISTLIFLYFGFELFTITLAAMFGLIFNIIAFFVSFRVIFIQLIKMVESSFYDWKSEFFHLIWKYAISWSSGYFIFQIYTPLVFHFHGSIYAGKVGISLSLANALFSISNVWLYTITPQINMCAAKKDWIKMDNLIKKNVILSFTTFLTGSIFIIFIMLNFKDKFSFLNRFLNLKPIVILLVCMLLQTILNGLAIYLRAHKKEPLVLPSLISAIFIASTTFIVAKFMSSDYLFLGYLISFIFVLPWFIVIFVKKRREWHM